MAICTAFFKASTLTGWQWYAVAHTTASLSLFDCGSGTGRRSAMRKVIRRINALQLTAAEHGQRLLAFCFSRKDQVIEWPWPGP